MSPLPRAPNPPRASTDRPGYRGVVVGASAGGLEALLEIFALLPSSFRLPIVIAQHLHKTDGGRCAAHLATCLALPVADVEDKEPLAPGHVYLAPADYHLLIEAAGSTLALSVDPRVQWSRPSIDVLFESAARAWKSGTIGVILSGANDDGSEGMRWIDHFGGLCIAQDPSTAKYPTMPQAAITRASISHVLPPKRIGKLLQDLPFDEDRRRPVDEP